MTAERHIGTREFRARLADVLDEVDQAGLTYLLERSGEPVAAVVPLDLYRRFVRPDDTSTPRGGRSGPGRVAEPATGPYSALLALAGTMSTGPGHTDIGRHKQRHLADIYAGKRRAPRHR